MEFDNIAVLSDEDFERVATAVFRRAEAEGGRLPRSAYFAKVKAFPTVFTEIVCVHEIKGGEPEILL